MAQVSLPRQPLFALAEETPLVMLAGQVYLCDAVEQPRDYLLLDGQRYALIPAARLLELEALYSQLFSAELRLYKLSYDNVDQLRREIKERVTRERRSLGWGWRDWDDEEDEDLLPRRGQKHSKESSWFSD